MQLPSVALILLFACLGLAALATAIIAPLTSAPPPQVATLVPAGLETFGGL